MGFYGEGKLSFFSPILFGACILIFAKQKGWISKILTTPPFILLGLISYSIYMTHRLLQHITLKGIDIILRKFDIEIHTLVNVDGVDKELLGMSLVQGDFWHVAVLFLVLLVSGCTYYYIEKPANLWIRGKVS